jgi:RNA polymerase sigma factor for flagellar operon FliA
LAWQIHQRVRGRVELADLIAYGQVGLVEAASRFDESQGNRFITYAYHRIRGAILDGLAKMEWFRHADFYAGRYSRLAREVLAGSDASAGTCEFGGIEEGARWLIDVSARLSIVFLASGLPDAKDRADAIADPHAPTPQTQVMLDELRAWVRESIDRLPEQGRQLLHWVYYEGLSLTAAGERMGLSKSWTSRLHDKMLRRLAASLRQQGVEAATS